jgi:hypothetical protein
MKNFFLWLIDRTRTTLFYRFGIGGTKMPPDMLKAVGDFEEETPKKRGKK